MRVLRLCWLGIFVGEIEHDADWEWVHFRGPEGNLNELASRTRAG